MYIIFEKEIQNDTFAVLFRDTDLTLTLKTAFLFRVLTRQKNDLVIYDLLTNKIIYHYSAKRKMVMVGSELENQI